MHPYFPTGLEEKLFRMQFVIPSALTRFGLTTLIVLGISDYRQAGNVFRQSLRFSVAGRHKYIRTNACWRENKGYDFLLHFFLAMHKEHSEDQHFSELRVKRLQHNGIKCCTEELKFHIFLLQKARSASQEAPSGRKHRDKALHRS